MAKEKKNGIDRRTFMKYSLGAGGGLVMGSGVLGWLGPVGAANPGDRVQKIVHTAASRSDHTELGRLVALAFKEIGVEVQVEVLEIGAFIAKTNKKHEAMMSALSWTGTPERIDPSFWLTMLYHSKYTNKGGRNYQHYRNPDYDKVVDASNAEMDLKKRVALVHKCQDILAHDLPIWTIGFPNILNAYNSEDWEGPIGMMGCGVGSEYSPWTWLRVKPKGKRKKIVTCNVNDLSTFGLGTRFGNDRQNIRLIYDTFLKLDPDLNLVPWAAKSWKVIDDTTVDITLREGMKFHDGKPVTIEDVKFTFDYIKARKMAMYKLVYDHIERTEILNANSFRFHLAKPYAPFLTTALVFAHILPKHIWESISDPDKHPNEKPIGSGPFKFGYWKRGQELYMEANKSHFNAPQIDGFYRKVIPSLQGIIGALENKEVDIEHERLSSEQADDLAKFPHITVEESPNHGVYELRGDMDKKPFSDLAFRRAVSHIIPRKDYMALVFGKAGRAGANSILNPDLKPWYNEKVPFDEYSIEKAKAILKQAGYTWDKKGLLHYPA